MTKRTAADVAFVLINGRNVIGALTQFDDKSEAIIEDGTVLGNSWRTQLYAGVLNAELSQEGYYEDEASGLHAALSSGLGSPAARVMSYSLEGTATGARFVGWEDAQVVNYQRLPSRGALHKAKATYKTNGAVDEGRILRTWKNGSATGRTTGTPFDNGASTVGGGVGYLQYKSSAAAAANFSILHSSDNLTYAALLSFPTSSGAFGAARQVTTAVIERFAAVDYATGGLVGATAISYFIGLAYGITS